MMGLYTDNINQIEVNIMKKQLPALLAALLMTGVITLVMVVTSANALFNKNSVDVTNSISAKPDAAAVSISAVDQAKIQQLQDRINEYAQREKQYQQTIQDGQQQVQEAAQQIQQIRQLLSALQERGLIVIQPDGSILLAR
jgi:tRNA U34 5-carboxymethylaminomethyl modifying GTPase MnmE/TrmE